MLRPATDDPQALLFAGERSGRPVTDGVIASVHERMGYSVTTHGFRSAFKDWASEQTTFPELISEMCLAHVQGDAVVQAYRRSDLVEQRRQLMLAWANYCDRAAPAGAVVPIRSRA